MKRLNSTKVTAQLSSLLSRPPFPVLGLFQLPSSNYANATTAGDGGVSGIFLHFLPPQTAKPDLPCLLFFSPTYKFSLCFSQNLPTTLFFSFAFLLSSESRSAEALLLCKGFNPPSSFLFPKR